MYWSLKIDMTYIYDGSFFLMAEDEDENPSPISFVK